MKPAYYNEIDAYCAAWLRNLITAGHIPAGAVDERDIREVRGDDLKGYRQVHLFAGLGGWGYAARLAGIPDDEPIWTGSCPCQPLSSAGQRKGHADERHLWPAFQSLIAECRPATIFGEQVASKDGREWLAGVRADLEDLGYAIGAADLPAAGVGAPHIRQRLWWVADANTDRTGQHARKLPGNEGEREERPTDGDYPPQHNGPDGGLGITNGTGPQQGQQTSAPMGYGDTSEPASHWSDFDLIPCGDGKARRVEPGIQPLAHGIPNRVGKLRAAGNSIVPQVAAEFMMATRAAPSDVL